LQGVAATSITPDNFVGAGTPPVTGDTTPPAVVWTGFDIGGVETTFAVDFSESVQASGIGGITAFKNGLTALTITGATPATIANLNDSFTFAFTGITLAATDYVVLNYDAAAGSVTDLAGNPLPSGTLVFDSIGTLDTVGSTIDLTANPLPAGSYSPVYIRTHMGNDIVTGTSGTDLIKTGRGNDVINGSYGADFINLGESASYSDTVVLQSYMSGFYTYDYAGTGYVNNYSDTINGFVVNGAVEVDVNGVGTLTGAIDAAINDKLDLPSNTIVADVTNADMTYGNGQVQIDVGSLLAHSIAGGMITFGNAANVATSQVTINAANLNDALTYLQLNITGAGETVAFEYDSNSDGAADATYIFQGNSFGDDPITAVLNGVTGVTLGAGVAGAGAGGAGVNVVQLVDTTAPEINGVSIVGANSVEFEYSENVTVDLQATHGGILLNGTGTDIVSGVSVTGNVATITTSAAIGPTDWLLMTTATDFADTSGNTTIAGTTAAIGGDGDNTIDMSAFTGGNLYIAGFAGNDTLIGSALSDDIEGGAGADTVTGGAGADWFGFAQGDSPLVTYDSGSGNFTFGNSADIITDFSSGESIELFSNGGMAMQSPVNGLAADQSFFMVGGFYDAGTGVFGQNNVSGTDALIVYDGDATAGVMQTGIVLSGVTLAQLDAWNGYISHI